MQVKKVFRGIAFLLTLAVAAVSISKVNELRNSSASIIRNYKADSQTSLPKVMYNGEEMYAAKATYFDYYSDSQVGTGATPLPITDANAESKNTFGRFNQRIMEAMKYNVASECPAQYPLYQGRLWGDFTDNPIWNSKNNTVNETSNYWKAANHHQGLNACATQGLVDSKLAVDSKGETYMTQSNPANGKKKNVPYFDKNFLTSTKHTNSQLSVGGVKDNVAFPFRTEVENGVTYYEFDSLIDTVRFNSRGQLDYLGKNNAAEQVKDIDTPAKPGFFPENVPADSSSDKLNFGYGVKIEVPFIMTKDGKINGNDMIFEFRGDDDVWVFIDGILALDLGGAHPKLSGNINFATGKATAEAAKNNKVAFASRTLAGLKEGEFTDNSLGLVKVPTMYRNHTVDFSEELKKSLKDTDKVHTLTLFYMERGMYVANMKMKFNLPEPTRLDVANELKFDKVGATFTEETKKVAKKDVFLYDVVDKTNNRRAEIDMVDGDSMTFLNEFAEKTNLLVQETKLKSSTRVLSKLYSTSWVLKDQNLEMNKADGLVADDKRTSDRSILFANSDDKGTPNLEVKYTNQPIVNKFVITCSATDKFKETYPNYKDKEFIYTVTYKNVFGGGSTEQLYKGAYIVYDADGKENQRTTTDGIIKLKVGEKAYITQIPVLTELKVKMTKDDTFVLNKVKTTEGFKFDEATTTTTGAINIYANIVEFIVGAKVEKEADKEIYLTKENIKEITGEDIPVAPTPDKLEKVDKSMLDDVPKTGDSTDLKTWTVLMIVSLTMTFISAISIAKTSRVREY